MQYSPIHYYQMKYIYVLEDDTKLQKQIFEAIRKTDEQIQVRYFNSFEEFQKWIPLAIKSGRESINNGGVRLSIDTSQITAAQPDDELILMIMKDEWLGTRYVSLIKKTYELFLRKNLCTTEEPTRLVITAFENPDFDIKLVEEDIITNVIFKPFDQLILQQHLNYAITGHKLPSESFIHSVQTKQEVEMTKEVQMEAVGDVGFVTRSPREIKVGNVSKYYGEAFRAKGRIHVMGRCIACEPHPEFSGEFRVWFSFFGIPSRQISEIRQNMVKRNEIEFSDTLPANPQDEGKKWVILDAKKERAQKFTKIIEEVFKAQVEHFVSFENFAFQTDPMAQDSARKEKALSDLPVVKITFDLKGDKVVLADPDGLSGKKIFGMTWDDFKSKEFFSKLHPVSVAAWRDAMINGSKEPFLILVQNGPVFFPIKVKSIERVKEGKADQNRVEFVDPDPAEKTKWFQEKFPSPAQSQGIMIAEEYMRPDKKEFWDEFTKKTQGKFFTLHEKTPEEKMTRESSWLTDIFEESNDPVYVRRKLNWMFARPVPAQDKGSAYLNSGKEIIRVANPVEVAELSEASLIINYYRQIAIGAFRQFVLAKTGETFIEYRATCNFSCEHPSEKDMFQNHFIFFGVTDAHLKSIRLWILENYVQTKQQEGG